MSTLFYGFSGGAIADPDFIKIPKANINVSSKNGDAVTFGYKDMELFAKVGMGGHGDMWKENDIDPEDAILSLCGFTDDICLTGRFWLNSKLISFWDKNIEAGWLEKLVNDMKNDYGFDLSDYRVVCEIYEKQCVAITPLETFISMAPNQNDNLIQKLQSTLNKKSTSNTPVSLLPFEGGEFAPQLERDLSLPFMENKQKNIFSVKSLMERLSLLDDIKDSGDLLNESARDRKVKNTIKQAIPGAPEMFWDKMNNGKRNIEAFENKLLEEFNIDTPSHPGGINRRFEIGLARIAYGELHINNEMHSLLKPLVLKEIVQYISDNESASYDDNLNGESYASLLEKYKELDKVQDLLSNKKKRKKIHFPVKMGNSYTIHKIKTFEEAHKFFEYTNPNSRWCITYKEPHYKTYGLDNKNIAYFFTKDGFENIPCEKGDNYPYDEYGTSMFSIIITPEGNVRAATLRWNHEDDMPGDYADISKLSAISNIDIKSVCLPDNKGLKTIDEIENAILSQKYSKDEIEKKLNAIIKPYPYNEKLDIISLKDYHFEIIYSKSENKFLTNWFETITGTNGNYVFIRYPEYDELRDTSLEHVIKIPTIRGRFAKDGEILVEDNNGLTNIFDPKEKKLKEPVFFLEKYPSTGLFKIYATYIEEESFDGFAVFDENNKQIAVVPLNYYYPLKIWQNIIFIKKWDYGTELMLPILSTKTGYYTLYRAKSQDITQISSKIFYIKNDNPTPNYLLSLENEGHPILKEFDCILNNTGYSKTILYKINKETKEVTFYNGSDFNEISHEDICNMVLADHSYSTFNDYLELHFVAFTAIANKHGTLLTKFYRNRDLVYDLNQNTFEYKFPNGKTFTIQKDTNN